MDKMSTAFCESLYLHVSVYLDASVLDILWGKKNQILYLMKNHGWSIIQKINPKPEVH